ncbi:MAG: LysR family transcriptional regulator [Pseudomonadota bacterium]
MSASITALRYFLTAIDRGSIAKAAAHLGVVPSAVASAIEKVEETFDLKLVQRYPAKGIESTATGAALTQKIRYVVEEYDNLIKEGTELRASLSGNLSIGYYAPVAPAFMPDIVRDLVSDNPKVKVKFTECDNNRVQVGLLNGEFDLIIFVAETVPTGVEYETLIEVPLYLLVSSDHQFANRNAVGLSELVDQNLILLDLPFSNEYYRRMLESNGVDPRIVATASTTEMVRSLVGAGVGCSILNMRPVIDLSYAGDPLVSIPISDANESLTLALGVLGGGRRRLIQAFVDACRSYFQQTSVQRLVVDNQI